MNKKPNDDLTVIMGLGPVWQKRLQAAGVRTFKDIAALSSDELEARLKTAGQPVPTKSQSEAWIGQAGELVAAAEPSDSIESQPEKGGEGTKSPSAAEEWKPFASFVVEYQSRTPEGEAEQRRTRVHHVEADTSTDWPHIVTADLCRWMLQQSGEVTAPELEQLVQETRAQVQRELAQELEAQREAAQQELEQALEEERTRAHEALKQELNEVRIQIKQQLEQERQQRQEAFEQELEEKRAQAQLELGKELVEERQQAQDRLEKELDEKQAQAQLESERSLEEARNKAQDALAQELDQKRAHAEQELEQSLAEERRQAQEALAQELDQKRAQAQQELAQSLAEESKRADEDLKQEILEQEAVEEAQPSLETSEKDARPLPDEGVRPAQPPEIEPASEPQGAFTITQLQAYQPANAEEPAAVASFGGPFSGLVSSAESLKLVVDYALTEPPGPELIQGGAAHQVQLYTRELTTGKKDFLGSTKAHPFVEGRASYIANLSGITVESGVYELSAVLTTVQNGRPIVHHIMVTQLQAV